MTTRISVVASPDPAVIPLEAVTSEETTFLILITLFIL